MLKQRLIFGSLIIAMGVALIWADARLDDLRLEGIWQTLFGGREHPPPGLLLLLAVIGLIIPSGRELAALLRAGGAPAHSGLITTGGIVVCLSMYGAMIGLRPMEMGVAIIGGVLVIWLVLTLVWHARRADPQSALAAAGACMLALVYLGVLAGFLVGLRRWHSAWVVLAVLAIIKSSDIGAYAAGKLLGRHKLIPWLSPGKTWEGLIGSVALAAGVAAGCAYLSHVTSLTADYRWMQGEYVLMAPRYAPGWSAAAGALFALLAQGGDLMMSMFKRDAGVKDSGSIIPGFGGVLDIVDSPLLVAPLAFWLLAPLGWG